MISSIVRQKGYPMSSSYERTYRHSIEHPEDFWDKAARDVQWYKRYSRVLDDTNPPFYRWFPDAEINTCYNALDYHVMNGRADQPALIYDSPVTDTIETFTYSRLRDEVARFAGVADRFPGLGHKGVVGHP